MRRSSARWRRTRFSDVQIAHHVAVVNEPTMSLTKSQRITTIQTVAERMQSDDWTMIDLVLKQFGLRTSDQWSDDRKGYVVEMVSEAKDDELAELAEHFGIEVKGRFEAPIEPDAPPYWIDGQLRVFISHLTDERKQASDLQSALTRFGMGSFVAHNDIHPTLEWQIEIETALATCDLLVALIHPRFIESRWCDQEVGYALGRGIPVFTVRCGADPHGFVSRFQAFNGNGKGPLQIAAELFEAAIEHKKLHSKMADVLVSLFENSGSFAAAKARVGYLERLKVWDRTYSERLKRAVETNDQISGSWGVPDQVDKLIDRWK